MVSVPDQPKAHGVLRNIVSFSLQLILGAEPVIKEVFLPHDFRVSCHQSFPISDYFRHYFVTRECDDHVQMIRHQKKHMQPPMTLLMIECGIFSQFGGGAGQTKLVAATFLAANRDEEPRAVRHERWRNMRQ